MAPKYAAAGLTALTAYFAYHAFAGPQGLGHWSEMQAQLADRRAELKSIHDANELLRIDIARLTPGTVDADLVEVLARDDLGFAYPTEIVIIGATDRAAF
jgi:cell division protein FtsB